MTKIKIDVVMPTKNRLKPCLPECLEAMKREIEVNRFIVIDAFSDDGTVEYIEKFCKENKIEFYLEQTERPLPKARERGIKRVQTDWFLFLDSDIILQENYINKLSRYIDSTVGAVQGRKKRSINSQNIPCIPSDKTWILKRKWRGGTHATLIRKKAVQGIEIPRELKTWEDQYIRKYVEGDFPDAKNSYKWIFAPDAIFEADESDSFESKPYVGKLLARYDLEPFYWIIGRALIKRRKVDLQIITEYLKEKIKRFG